MWGWVSPIGESVVAFAVMSDDGDVLATRVMSVHAVGVQDWDATVRALGYERTGRWRPTGGLFWCDVAKGASGGAQSSDVSQG